MPVLRKHLLRLMPEGNITITQMKHYLSLIVSIIVIIIMPSCSVAKRIHKYENEYNQLWVGKTYAEIVNEYGAPRSEPDGRDGIILSYERYSKPSESNRIILLYTHFYLDENGICYSVKSNHAMPNGYIERRYKTLGLFTVGILGVGGLIAGIFMSM